jgi:hypothetical protein
MRGYNRFRITPADGVSFGIKSMQVATALALCRFMARDLFASLSLSLSLRTERLRRSILAFHTTRR